MQRNLNKYKELEEQNVKSKNSIYLAQQDVALEEQKVPVIFTIQKDVKYVVHT